MSAPLIPHTFNDFSFSMNDFLAFIRNRFLYAAVIRLPHQILIHDRRMRTPLLREGCEFMYSQVSFRILHAGKGKLFHKSQDIKNSDMRFLKIGDLYHLKLSKNYLFFFTKSSLN